MITIERQELSEKIQELLDAGMSRNQAAYELGIHHEIVSRVINRYQLEFYQAFDEPPTPDTKPELDDMDFEDAIDDDLKKAWDGEKVTLNTSINFYHRYVERRYDGIFNYFKLKRITPLMDYFEKRCGSCGEIFPIRNFFYHVNKPYGLSSSCKSCYKVYSSKWVEENPEAVKANGHKRRALENGLIGDISEEDVQDIYLHFGNKCALSRKSGVELHLDHFIAVATGHCGSYVGNLIPLSRQLNSSKNAKNPFRWLKRRSGVELSNLRNVLTYLATKNNMSFLEYVMFVNWCYENKRSADEVVATNDAAGCIVDSRSIWRSNIERNLLKRSAANGVTR